MPATTYNGITFSLGDLSFADGYDQHDPQQNGGPGPFGPTANPQNIVGAPDDTFLSLGNGGRIRTIFTDNVLTGDGTDAPDLYIFDSSPVEERAVAISFDGSQYIQLGTFTSPSATMSGIDIDAFLRQFHFDQKGNFDYEYWQPFKYVQITDRPAQFTNMQSDIGADVDAVGAISSARTVLGTNMDDSLLGSMDREFFDTGMGADTVSGGDGNDLVYAGEGNDIVFGGGGTDFIYGNEGNDQLFGGLGPDADYINGGSGMDQIYANDGADTIDGGADNDTIGTGFGSDLADGGLNDDMLFGGGGGGADTLSGSAGNDIAFGGDGDDSVMGGGGNDEFGGGAGDDYVNGDNGSDTVYGGAGSDVVIGGDDSDTVYSGTGADTVFLGIDDKRDNFAVDGDRDVFGVISNNGADTIYGFETARDDIDLSQNIDLNTFAQVQAAMSNGGAGVTVIDLQNGNGSLTLINVSMANLDASNFIF